MAADNWATCPKCLKLQKEKKERLAKKAADAYGSVSVQEFDELRSKADETSLEIDSTFKEDYEVGVDPNGLFYMSYYGSCNVCGLAKEQKYNEQLSI